MKDILRLLKEERGSAIILVTLVMGGMITLLGLIVDGGHLFMSQSHLQKTANAAALSGAQEILNDQASVDQVVGDILVLHGEENSLSQSNVEYANRTLHVELQKDVPLFFTTLFGITDVRIQVGAKASLNAMGEARGAVPLGIDESVSLTYGDTYELKVDAGDSTAGNFGVLALDGPGAKSYEESLTYGFDEKLKIGDVINTQTGNIAGPTENGISYRINNCPYPVGEIHHRDCSRVMLVLVYKPYSQTTNQLKSVEITGFAYFYVTENMSNNDESIKGIFIRRAGTGIAGTAETPDRGAYAIRLTE